LHDGSLIVELTLRRSSYTGSRGYVIAGATNASLAARASALGRERSAAKGLALRPKCRGRARIPAPATRSSRPHTRPLSHGR